MHTDKQMNASYQASLVNRRIRRFTGTLFMFMLMFICCIANGKTPLTGEVER